MSDNGMAGLTLRAAAGELQERVNARRIESGPAADHLREREREREREGGGVSLRQRRHSPPPPRRKRLALSSSAPPLCPPLSSGGHTLPRGRPGRGGRGGAAPAGSATGFVSAQRVCFVIIRPSLKIAGETQLSD